MSKFQVGDRVRVVENSKYHGVVSTIDGVIDGGRFFTIDGYSPNFQEEDLEVAEQKQPMGFDDKEPWDGEWLNSIGFADDGKYGWSIMLPNGVKLNIGHDYDATLADGERQIHLTSRIYSTRGDVRLLCAALGAELKGGV